MMDIGYAILLEKGDELCYLWDMAGLDGGCEILGLYQEDTQVKNKWRKKYSGGNGR